MHSIKTWLIAVAMGAMVLTVTPADVLGHGRGRDCCPPPPMINVVLQVCHPCTCCKVDVPVCIPACCIDAPCVRFERTLIGPGRSVFTWACGHQVVVRYKACGGVVVRD